MAPKGTHDWKKFIKPEELDAALKLAGFEPGRHCGIVFKPLMGAWSLSERDLSVNYIMAAEAA
jgi:2-polyprenyl-6-hydroxyphenyl methylase / 3-demethylubiquinone-9 3-methyltransferase